MIEIAEEFEVDLVVIDAEDAYILLLAVLLMWEQEGPPTQFVV